MIRPLAALLLALLLAGCAATPERPEVLRQALLGLSDRAATRLLESSTLPSPATDQVLLLAAPEVDDTLGIGRERLRESLTRALLGASNGPQVLDWSDAMATSASANQWRLESRLESSAPRLQLSDRELLPYRFQLTLMRPDGASVLWETEISGAFDATAL